MIRILAILVVWSALVACDGKAPEPTVITEGLPPLAFGPLVVSPGGFDVGAVEPNTMQAVRVTLTNTAPEPMTIVYTDSDCKCTLPEKLDGTVIQPGESIPMNATFQLRAAPGVKEAKMQVSFRVGQEPIRHAIIKVKGEVTMAVRAVPAYVDALKGVASGTVKVESTGGEAFRIVSAGGAPPRYADGFKPDRDKPRSTYTLRWDVQYPERQEDCKGERLWWAVETDHPDCPILPLRIRHECTGLLMDLTYAQRGWMFTNYMVNAGAVRVGKPVDLDVDVRLVNEQAATGIYGAQSLTPGVKVEFLALMEPAGEDPTVKIRLTALPGTEGFLYAMALIESSGGNKEIGILARVLPN